MTLTLFSYPLISCLIFSEEFRNHDEVIVKITLDKGEVDDYLETRVVVLHEEKVPGHGNKSVSTQLKQQVKDLPRVEFEGACAQRKVMSVPEDDEDASSEQDCNDQALLKESLKCHLMVLL